MYTREFITGKLNWTLSEARGIAEILDFDFVPFGNAYYVTAECGGESGEYDSEERRCFQARCGALQAGASRSADCFAGKVICQHGETECASNREFACAKRISTGLSYRYMPFVTCVENAYSGEASPAQMRQLADSCAQAAGIDQVALSKCVAGSAGDEAQVEAAQNTPDHIGVPYITVDGVAMVPDTEDELLYKVCEATQSWSRRPLGCQAEELQKYQDSDAGNRMSAATTAVLKRNVSLVSTAPRLCV
jgi:hypothetical protein